MVLIASACSKGSWALAHTCAECMHGIRKFFQGSNFDNVFFLVAEGFQIHVPLKLGHRPSSETPFKWLNIDCWLGSFMFVRGSGTVRNVALYFCDFSGGPDPPPPPSPSNLYAGPSISGVKNISILHLSCRTSDLQFSLVLQTHSPSFKKICNKEYKGVICNMTSSSNSSQSPSPTRRELWGKLLVLSRFHS